MFRDPSKDNPNHYRWWPKSHNLAPNDEMSFRETGLHILIIKIGNVRFEMLNNLFGLDVSKESVTKFKIRTPAKIIAGNEGASFTIQEVYCGRR